MSKRFTKFIVSWSFLFIPLFYLFISILLHTGYKEGYVIHFSFAALISLLLVTFTTHLIKSVIGLLVIVWITGIFWGYMDHPWFAGPETNTCNGRCFGWFSFENDDPSIIILLEGTIVMVVTAFIKSLVLFIRNNIKRSEKSV